jgi:hypothetical protein
MRFQARRAFGKLPPVFELRAKLGQNALCIANAFGCQCRFGPALKRRDGGEPQETRDLTSQHHEECQPRYRD